MRALVWFRSDLRVRDNPALYEAARRADRGVIAVFVCCHEQWSAHDDAPVKIAFQLEGLRSLARDLEAVNIAVRVLSVPRFDRVPEALLGLAKKTEADAIWFNREYGFNERCRDEAVVDAFELAGFEAHGLTDQTLFEPGTLRTGDGRFYSVFTPFRRRWAEAIAEDPGRLATLPAPRKLPEMVGSPQGIPEGVPGFVARPPTLSVWPAGEREARSRLDRFLSDRVNSYEHDRDLPGSDSTSQISPYLTGGMISLKECVLAAAERNGGSLDSGSPGAVQWITECAWREFYKHVLVGYPRVSKHRAFKPETERIRWEDNPSHLAAWHRGETGFPLVDAGMRQLAATGWMHNRARMVTAMFFTKNLFLDWRLGEKHFMRSLVDGDLAANNGGWQWSASTGTDAAPYFRVFNPWSQSRKCDAGGAYIHRFVPELRSVSPSALHDPGALEAVRPDSYPAPVVDHASTRARAIEAFKSIRG